MGDPFGVGGELSLMAWRDRAKRKIPPFVVIDCVQRLQELAGRSGLPASLTPVSSPSDALNVFDTALPVLDVELNAQSPHQTTLTSITTAVDLTIAGQAKAVVTNPINKKNLYDIGFAFQGHTDFLEDLARQKTGTPCKSIMMLASDQLRTVPVTVHIPLEAVSKSLTEELISDCIRIVSHALIQDFGIGTPRIAVSGLNPHAGEKGALGTEDEHIIEPALKGLRKEGLNITGPLPADTMFHTRARKAYDVAVCMYHDQALIPLKTLDFDRGVNVTLGLPFIRTSPDHGTAEDIAGTGTANPESFIEALKLAHELADHRSAHIQKSS